MAKGVEPKGLIFVVASWFRFLQGINEEGEEYVINDPYGKKLQRLAQLGGKDSNSLMQFKVVFGESLAKNKHYRALLKEVLYSYYENGAVETLERVL